MDVVSSNVSHLVECKIIPVLLKQFWKSVVHAILGLCYILGKMIASQFLGK